VPIHNRSGALVGETLLLLKTGEKIMPKTKFRYEIESEEFLRIALSFISRKINGETLDYGYYFMTDKGIVNLVTTDKEKK
jgi:hypothetical protein